MLTDILLTFIIMPLQIMSTILTGITSFFSSIVPNQIYSAIDTAISYLGYFNGIFPVDTLIFCIATLATFYTAYYTIKVILWLWGFVPFVGSGNVDLPRGNTLDLRRSATNSRNTINLRTKQKGTIGMKDIR